MALSSLPVPLPPALHANHAGIWLSDGRDDVLSLSRGEALARAADTPLLMVNAPLLGARLGHADLSGLDLLELFAFLFPARFVIPTVAGLARALAMAPPANDTEATALVPHLALAMLDWTGRPDWAEREGAWTSLKQLERLRWSWVPLLRDRIAQPAQAERWLFSRLPQWEDQPPRPQPRPVTLADEEVLGRLAALTGHGAETRSGQRDFSLAAADGFDPRTRQDMPNIVLAEAGTGIGKTLGYLAPATLWAERAGGTVWISTYTKALQRQLDREARRHYPDDASFRRHVVIRKGRENYLCLLNLEDALQGGFAGRAAVLAQFVARWAAYSRDGDMVGGDMPGWLPALFRRAGATALTDRRGECIYAGCPHFRTCFIERASRASQGADIVIANHALVMINAARGRETQGAPTRIVFDEGHHLFDAADSTFAAALTGREAIELRRWIMGPEKERRGRRRGLAARLSDVASYDADGAHAIDDAREAARALPGEEWMRRVHERAPDGEIEALLCAVRDTVYARAERDGKETDPGYGLEVDLAEADGALIDAATEGAAALEALLTPLQRLAKRLVAVIELAPDWLDTPARARIDGAISALGWRCDLLRSWIALLLRVGSAPDPDFVDWLAVDRAEGREYDIGLHRHWLDPTRPLAEVVLQPAHGVLVTSATLRAGGEVETAIGRTGASHLAATPRWFDVESPFNYASQSEVLIVTDIKRGDLPALAGAYARLIEAAGGGTLGLFTAIRRLRSVQARIADRLARAGLPLYAQHVDPFDPATLIDMFRDDPRASLLGTDALRDGVDVPGDSLRLVVMEGVPWPKPSVLNAVRRQASGAPTAHDDRQVRARLAQAFGRLIRRADDRGQFVILSAAMPSRLLGAFPPGVPILRIPLDEAIERVRSRLGSATKLGQEAQNGSRIEGVPTRE
ncbi:putative ATP-dependent helicase [Sphingobium sp. SYK-6]|uniref:ATP-dependent DNA helicase n=1 Tax=Sphingobium sp. (strain NBRC 103272 / SYK-6) TaxID=627192 RepID=UPI000227699F|nr:ATP-dependent DNA helicase [Sphingobium sp. SYK-6]BAK65363.1 putative ATP-dependent helicase [Sphingobium sp. SYK-6]